MIQYLVVRLDQGEGLSGAVEIPNPNGKPYSSRPFTTEAEANAEAERLATEGEAERLVRLARSDSFSYQKRAVAFIDVLGFKELVKKSSTDPTERNKIIKLIETDKLLEAFASKFLTPDLLDAAIFSDSFILSVESDKLIYLIREVGYLCRRILLLLELPCRGAITAGLLHHRERIVVGPALVEAHELEKSVAIYPRVILDDASMELWKNEVSPDSETFELETLVKRDRDGQHFIDIFNHKWPSFLQPTDFAQANDLVPADPAEFLEAASKPIKSGLALAKRRGDAKLHAKYSWLESEYNDSQSAI